MRKIPLTQGKFALVDDCDFDSLNQFKWCAGVNKKVWYARRSYRKNGKKINIKMHRYIMGFPSSGIDHKNGDGLDNRRSNLRIATNSQNLANRGITSRNTSGFKGVTWNKASNKWQAQIRVSNNNIYLGCFSDLLEAHQSYINAARKYFGEFAKAA
jgi:hypothetical protein